MAFSPSESKVENDRFHNDKIPPRSVTRSTVSKIRSYPLLSMEIIGKDDYGRDIFIIIIYETWADPLMYAYKSSLPDYVFELEKVKAIMDRLLTPGLEQNIYSSSVEQLIYLIKRLRRIDRWYFKDNVLSKEGKLCKPYYFTLENIMESMEEPICEPFTLDIKPHIFYSLFAVICSIEKYKPFNRIKRTEFEKLIKDHFELQNSYTEFYSSFNRFYKLKTEMEVEGKGIVYMITNSNIDMIFLYENPDQ